jgi:hypothetical protein
MSARGILEIVKATGQADIAPGYKLFSREYFKAGRIVDLDSTHRIKLVKDAILNAHFIFVAASEVSGGLPDIAPCKDEKMALIAIKAILKEATP